jgi:hypothetical protein
MNPATACAALLALAVVAGSARLLWHHGRAAAPRRPRPWRTGLLLLGQASAAVLLYLAMWPPPSHTTSNSLAVITANATAGQLARIDPRERVVALVDVPAIGSRVVERVPDLATALRRHPSTTRLRVIGAGLSPRDLDAVGDLSLGFEPAPLPRGLVELWYPRQVPSGATWRITGRVHAVPGGYVELLDPARRRVARAAPATDGRFELQAEARAPGRAHFSLRIIDSAQRLLEDIDVPLLAVTDAPLRVLVLSGAPGPETKYLRRWALDAGVDLRSEIVVRPGMRVMRSATSLAPDTLRELDLVIVDERAWRSLGPAGRADLQAAVREGLGVLVRITGTLPPGELDALQSFGFDVHALELPRTTRIAGAATEMTRRPLRVTARDGVPLLRSDSGEPLALWRAEGQGRVALWWLSDSFRMTLDGASAAYGTLWSHALSTVARARGKRGPAFQDVQPRIHRRQVICEVAADASVRTPDGRRVPLLRDPSSGCAAHWPETAGWHALEMAGVEWPFHVRAADEAAALAAGEMRSATLAIAASRTAPSNGAQSSGRVPGSPWAYLLACLVALGATWWLERSHAGREPASDRA